MKTIPGTHGLCKLGACVCVAERQSINAWIHSIAQGEQVIMDLTLQFLLVISAFIGAIIIVKVFFTFWRILEKRLHPEKFDKRTARPEFSFPNLKGKKATVTLKNGEQLQDCEYQFTHLFGDGEFAFVQIIYFEFITANKRRIFLSNADILKIETDADR